MELKREIRGSAGKMAGYVLLALVIGILVPVVAVFQLELALQLPVLMLGGIFAVFLRARAGRLPAGVLAVAELISSAWFLGMEPTLMLVTAAILPGLYVMRGVIQKQAFFRQMFRGIVAYAAGMVATIFIAYALFGGGMVSRIMDVVRDVFVRIPDATLQSLLDTVRAALPAGNTEMAQSLTLDGFRSMMMGMLDMIEQIYAQQLPGALFAGTLLSGVLSVFWGNWTMARQGKATNESFTGMSCWFLPGNITSGAVVLWLAGLILANSSYTYGATVYATIGQIAGVAFIIQAFASLDRRMLQNGRSLSRRRLMITLLAVAALLFHTAASVLAFIGAASALVGRRGVLRLWVQRRQDQNKHSDHNDSNE